MPHIGERIREVRESQGMNQEEFSRSLNISKHALVNYERGYSSPQYALLEQIIRDFSVADPAYFLLGNTPRKKSRGSREDAMIKRLLDQAQDILEKGGDDGLGFAQNIETFHRLIFSHNATVKRRAGSRPFDPTKEGGP